MFKTTIAFIFFVAYGFGQQLSFHGDFVKNIIIETSIGYYDIEKQISIGENESFDIQFNVDSRKYFAHDYQKTSYKHYTQDSSKNEEKKKHFHLVKNSINYLMLDSLLFAFTKSEDTINCASLKITTRYFLKLTNRKHIRKVVKMERKRHRVSERILGSISWGLEDKKDLILTCQNKDTFNYFLTSQIYQPNTEVISDYGAGLDIKIITNSKEFHFIGNSPNPYGLWTDYSEPIKPDSLGLFQIKQIFNPNTTQQLTKILPKKFLGKKSANKSIIDGYLYWYLLRKGIFF